MFNTKLILLNIIHALIIMGTIETINTYRTDTNGSWGIGQEMLPSSWKFSNVLVYAIERKAKIIVKPSRGNWWYIKGTNENKSYDEIKEHLIENQNNEYRSNSMTWLISYF